MKWILVWIIIFSGLMSNAQQGQAPQQEPPYKRSPTIPPLELLRPDSTKFTKDDLKKQNTLIMYFSPDCDHCIHQTEDMIKRMNDLKKLQILKEHFYVPFARNKNRKQCLLFLCT